MELKPLAPSYLAVNPAVRMVVLCLFIDFDGDIN